MNEFFEQICIGSWLDWKLIANDGVPVCLCMSLSACSVKFEWEITEAGAANFWGFNAQPLNNKMFSDVSFLRCFFILSIDFEDDLEDLKMGGNLHIFYIVIRFAFCKDWVEICIYKSLYEQPDHFKNRLTSAVFKKKKLLIANSSKLLLY